MPVQIVLALRIEVWERSRRLRKQRVLVDASEDESLSVHFVRLALDILKEERLRALAGCLVFVDVQQGSQAVKL